MRHYSKREEAKLAVIRGKSMDFRWKKLKKWFYFSLTVLVSDSVSEQLNTGNKSYAEIDDKIQSYMKSVKISRTEAIFREKLTQLLEDQS